MKLIGIAGRGGSGKDTVAAFLVDQYGYEQVSFAAILKKMLAVAGMPEPANRDDKEKNIEGFNFSWRHAAQTLGTEYGRVCLDENIWVMLTMRNLKPDGKYVFSDIRFPNEQQAILNAGGTIIHLEGRKADLGEASAHASEQPLEVLHNSFVVHNTGSISYLQDKIRVIVSGDA